MKFGLASNRKLKVDVNASAQNIFTLTKYGGPNPEIPSGMDNYRLPQSPTFSIGFDVTM